MYTHIYMCLYAYLYNVYVLYMLQEDVYVNTSNE